MNDSCLCDDKLNVHSVLKHMYLYSYERVEPYRTYQDLIEKYLGVPSGDRSVTAMVQSLLHVEIEISRTVIINMRSDMVQVGTLGAILLHRILHMLRLLRTVADEKT